MTANFELSPDPQANLTVLSPQAPAAPYPSAVTDAPRAVTNTSYGVVTDRQVTYYYKKGWFRNGIREDLPMRHITSVRLETSRHPVWGILFLVLGLSGFAGGSSITVVLGLVFVAFAVLLLWGSPRVVVNTAGGDTRPATSWPWTKPEAEHFVMALRQELFKRL
jgi:hypothetical protein